MPEAVIVSACRTAIGTSKKGSLSETTAFQLAQAVIEETVQRAGVAPELIDDLIFAESLAGGGAIGRYAALEAGLTSVPGAAINRHCAGGLSSVQMAAASIRAGMDDAVIAGGVQSSSTAPKSRYRDPETDQWDEEWVSPAHRSTPEAPVNDMSITVGWNAAVEAGVSREDMDAWALRSHRNAIAAIDAGNFDQEIIPVKVKNADGEWSVFEVDEHPRRASTAEKLASLNVLHPEIPGFSITAGNASGINDAAAALLLTSDTFATEHGLAPLARVLAWANTGTEPARTGLAPITAIPKALARAGLSIDDVDVFEINEAFAAMCVATVQTLGIDPDKVNVNGSGCSLGHPIAATGSRMITTLIYELRRRGGGIGVAAMCAGGGMGSATVIEVPAP
jgi:acetyl-CoA acetyltransferase family protein